jgi:arginine deiminase
LTFESSFNYKKAQEEAQNIVNILRLKGINVVTLKEMLLSPTKTKELKKFIHQNLQVTQSKDLSLNLDEIKNKIINTNSPPILVDFIFDGVSAKLYKNEESTSGTSGDISIDPLVDIFYMRDQMITTDKGIVLCNFESKQRIKEVSIIKFALKNIGITPIYEVKDEGRLEGGDFFMNGDTIFIGIGPRTNEEGAEQLMKNTVFTAKTIVLVKDRLLNQSQMHLDTYFNMLDSNLVVLAKDRMSKYAKNTASLVEVYHFNGKEYVKTKENLDFAKYLESNNYTIIPISQEDSKQLATNFITISPREIIGPDGVSKAYKEELKKHNVKAIWVDMKNIKKGYGAARCITQPIIRN